MVAAGLGDGGCRVSNATRYRCVNLLALLVSEEISDTDECEAEFRICPRPELRRNDIRRPKSGSRGFGNQADRLTTSFVYPPIFIPATRQDEPQAASKDAPSAPGSLKVALRAGSPLSARILNHAPPTGLVAGDDH